MRIVRTSLRLVAALAAATAVAAVPVASAKVDRNRTTEPTNFAIFTVKLGSGGVSFLPNQTTTSGTTGEFKIFNTSKQTRRFSLAGRATKALKPRVQTIFFLLFDRAGSFAWRSYGTSARTKVFKGTFEVTPDPNG
jgi:hypothetical protein